jgi:choline-sulfatase
VHGYDLHSRCAALPSSATWSGAASPAAVRRLADERERLRRESDAGRAAPPPERLRGVSGLYDDKLAAADAEVGFFLDQLAARRLLENTVVIFFSDHGEEFGEHGAVGHGLHLYEETLRVPLMIRAPGLAPGRVRESVSLLDIFPTVAALLGERLPARLKEQLRGADVSRRVPPGRSLFAATEYLLAVNRSAARSAAGLKLLTDELSGLREVYDLPADPQEARNLYGEAGHDAWKLEEALLAAREFMGGSQ